MSRAAPCATIAVLALALSSCQPSRKPKTPPAPAPRPFQNLPQRAETPPPVLEPPPPAPSSDEPQQPLSVPGTNPTLPPPATRRPSPAGPRVPAAEPPTAPAPQLRPMLTQAQRQELERAVNERIGRAQSVLASMAGRRLIGGQAEMVNQIRTFIKQAAEARDTDLLRANNLAERAEVLAQELAKRVR